MLICIYLSSYLLLKKGFIPARFYLISWGVLASGIISVNVGKSGYLSPNFFTVYGYQITSLFEMTLLTLALSDRVRVQRKQMQKSLIETLNREREAKEALQTLSENLEHSIATRTLEMQKERDRAEEAVILKDKFISIVSHDLKSPLLSVTSFLDILESENKLEIDPETIQRLHNQLRDSIHGLLEMIDQLLNIGRLKSGQIHLLPEYFDLAPLIDETVMLCSGFAAEKGIRLEVRIPENIQLLADRMLYKEVLQNLISNAIKFCKQDDTISIFVPPDALTTVAIQDSGVGIEPEIIQSIFRHRSTSTVGTAKERGTGLGLLFCMDILEAHGGALNVNSLPNEGSTFYVTLPPARNLLLVVDDSEKERKEIRKKLATEEIRIIEALDGEHALEIVQLCRPRLILSDINMPEMGGLDLLHYLKASKELGDIPVLLMTSEPTLSDGAGSGMGEIAIKRGADDFFLKPVDTDRLIKALHRYF